MFQDEEGFGRITKPKYRWRKKIELPCVPCHHIHEYRYVYGAVEPLTGEKGQLKKVKLTVNRDLKGADFYEQVKEIIT